MFKSVTLSTLPYFICMSSTQRFQLLHGFVSYILQYSYSWINYAANARNVAAPSAWSADFYDSSRNAYRNKDLRVKMFHLLLRTMLCFDNCRAWAVLVQT